MAYVRDLSPNVLNVSQIAATLLMALRRGDRAGWMGQLEMARLWAAAIRPSSTLEMERLEALSGALEAIGCQSHTTGAIRLLEQLAGSVQKSPCQNRPAANAWPLLPGTLAVVPCSQFVQ